VQVGSLTTWLNVSIDYNTSAIKTDGTLWVWGRNNAGQLGQSPNPPMSKSSPIQVGSLNTWLTANCGFYTTLAKQTNSTLWGIGVGSLGSLGLGNGNNVSSPVQVGAFSSSFSTTAGATFMLQS